MNDYEKTFERIQSDPRYQKNLDWGEARPGHPEGTVRAHMAVPAFTGGTWTTGSAAHSLVFRQSRIIAHHEMAVDLLNEVESHADDDQQAGAAVEAGNAV